MLSLQATCSGSGGGGSCASAAGRAPATWECTAGRRGSKAGPSAPSLRASAMGARSASALSAAAKREEKREAGSPKWLSPVRPAARPSDSALEAAVAYADFVDRSPSSNAGETARAGEPARAGGEPSDARARPPPPRAAAAGRDAGGRAEARVRFSDGVVLHWNDRNSTGYEGVAYKAWRRCRGESTRDQGKTRRGTAL